MAENELRHFPDIEAHRDVLMNILTRSAPPLFLAERRILHDRFSNMADSLSTHWANWTIAYSFKTNYQIAESRALQNMGAGAEVVSGHEYRLAKNLGYTGPEIVFNGPYKTADDLRTGITEGALINVNDAEELQRIEEIARAMNSVCPVGIRVSVPLSEFPPSRFGFSVADGEATDAAKQIWRSPHLQLTGLHLHLRGDMDNPAWYGEGCQALVDFLKSWPAENITSLEYIDLGGGFPGHMTKPEKRKSWDVRPIDDYIVAITRPLGEFFAGRQTPRLIFEPGRYLVNDAIIFISRIISVKDRSGRQQITCNGATMMLSVTRHRAPILRVFRPDMTPRDGQLVPSSIYGASCYEEDVLLHGEICRVEAGDLLVHFSAGAYNSSLNPAFIYPCPILQFLDYDPPGSFNKEGNGSHVG